MKTTLLILAALVVLAIALPLIAALARLLLAVVVGVFMLLLSVIAGIGYISLAIAGIALVVLYQLWGAANIGWALAVALLIGLGSMLALFSALGHTLTTRIRAWRQPRNPPPDVENAP